MRLFRFVPMTLSAIMIFVILLLAGTRVPGLTGHLGLLVVISLVLLVLGLVLDAARLRQRSFEFHAFAPLPPDEILDRADTWFAGTGWEVLDGPDDRVVVRREPTLSLPTLLLLLVAGIVPGLIYLVVARRAQPVTITIMASSAEGGAEAELAGSGLSSEALAFFRGLHARPRGRRSVPRPEPAEPAP